MKCSILAAVLAAPIIIAQSQPAELGSPADRPSGQACHGVDGYTQAFGGRRTFFLKPDQLIPIKAVRDTDPAVRTAYAALIARADAALARKAGSVMDKTTIPLSGDRHDYISIAPYWWPDPANPT